MKSQDIDRNVNCEFILKIKGQILIFKRLQRATWPMTTKFSIFFYISFLNIEGIVSIRNIPITVDCFEVEMLKINMELNFLSSCCEVHDNSCKSFI